MSVGYHDDDIVIIDNVKGLVESRSARVTMNVLVVAISGKAIGNVKGETIELNANQVFVSSPNATFNDFMMSPDFEFKAMFFTNRILQSFLREKMGVWNEMIYVHRIRVFTMGELDVVFFSQCLLGIVWTYESDTSGKQSVAVEATRQYLPTVYRLAQSFQDETPHGGIVCR